MATTRAEDNQKFTDVTDNFEVFADASGGAPGTLDFAGNLWPPGVNSDAPRPVAAARVVTPAGGGTARLQIPTDPGSKGKQMRREVETAFADARALLNAGFIKAFAGVNNRDEEAALLMTKWFGARHTTGNDWWRGAYLIIGRLQAQLLRDIHLYYRGDDSLIGRPNDYPGGSGNLVARDVAGYAETMADDENGVIGLCKAFFARQSGGVFKTARTGRDSIGGCIVHELSHNYCGTLDHELQGQTCYGEADCLRLATDRRSRAWYNADNIEYFCEDAHFGVVAARAAIASGATNTVRNLSAAHRQIADALSTRPAPQAVRPGPAQTTGRIAALTAAVQQARAVAQNPSLQPSSVGSAKTAALRSRFEQQ